MFLIDRIPIDNLFLTAREAEVVWYCADGLTNNQIAERMNVSPHTIERHRENIRERFALTGYHAFAQFATKIRPELENWVM